MARLRFLLIVVTASLVLAGCGGSSGFAALKSPCDGLGTGRFTPVSTAAIWVACLEDSGSVGLFRSDDGGGKWQPETTPPELNEVGGFGLAASSPLAAVAFNAVAPTPLMWTSDGGRSWTPASEPRPEGSAAPTSVAFASPRVAFATVDATHGGSELWRSTNGGKSWSVLPVAVSGAAAAYDLKPVVVIAAGPRDLWLDVVACVTDTLHPCNEFTEGSRPELLRSVDGGEHFTPVGYPPHGKYGASSFVFADSHVGFAIGLAGALYKTADGGQSWHRSGPGGSVRAIASAGGYAYAIFRQHLFERSPIGRDAWREIHPPFASLGALDVWAIDSRVWVSNDFFPVTDESLARSDGAGMPTP